MCRAGGRRCDRHISAMMKSELNRRKRYARAYKNFQESKTQEERDKAFKGMHKNRETTYSQIVKRASAWKNSWNMAERDAIRAYGSVLHDDINKDIRSGNIEESQFRDVIKNIDSVLERSPKLNRPHTVYRGIIVPDDLAEGLKEGENFPIGSSYISTSIDPDQALMFSRSQDMKEGDKGMILEIDTYSAAHISRNSPEEEIMLPRTSRLKIENITYDKMCDDGNRRTIVKCTHLEGKDLTYRGNHTAPGKEGFYDGENGNAYQYTEFISPSDIERYRHSKGGAQTMSQLENSDTHVTIYRAVPSHVNDINRGDWVTLSEEYAEAHKKNIAGDDVKILKARVRKEDVYTEGGNLDEWGYDGDFDLNDL